MFNLLDLIKLNNEKRDEAPQTNGGDQDKNNNNKND